MRILHRYIDAILFEDDSASMRETLIAAIAAKSNLSGANLSRADLSGAYLSRANLSEANLSGADLSGAYLSGADLSRADILGADLSGAYLRGADLSGAYLSGADLSGANLSGANLRGAYLSEANLSGVDILGGIAQIKNIRAEILARVNAEGSGLDMQCWHTCETTHCIAGWAIHLHPQGAELESKYGPSAAGAIIIAASGEKVPSFTSSNEIAVAWLEGATI